MRGNIRNYYGQEGSKYHSYDLNFPAESYFTELNKWDLKKNDIVLDIAAGQGFESKYLKKHFGAKVFETDISPYASKAGVEDRGLVLADAKKQPFADETFNGVHCKDAIVHILNKRAFFKEIARLLKPNGTLFLTTSYYSESFDSVDGMLYTEVELGDLITKAEDAGLQYVNSNEWYADKDEENWKNTKRRVILIFKKEADNK